MTRIFPTVYGLFQFFSTATDTRRKGSGVDTRICFDKATSHRRNETDLSLERK